jgi:hypothetical protein
VPDVRIDLDLDHKFAFECHASEPHPPDSPLLMSAELTPCPHCYAHFRADWSFCSHCGTRTGVTGIPVVGHSEGPVCEQCAAPVDTSGAFCWHCGVPLDTGRAPFLPMPDVGGSTAPRSESLGVYSGQTARPGGPPSGGGAVPPAPPSGASAGSESARKRWFRRSGEPPPSPLQIAITIAVAAAVGALAVGFVVPWEKQTFARSFEFSHYGYSDFSIGGASAQELFVVCTVTPATGDVLIMVHDSGSENYFSVDAVGGITFGITSSGPYSFSVGEGVLSGFAGQTINVTIDGSVRSAWL